jgi:hypothetical protein
MTVTKNFTIALLACVISGAAMSAQQKEQKDKDKSGAFSQPADPQPVVMPASQKPDEWKFKTEKERDAKQEVEDKKAAKKKAEEDRKAAAEAKKKDEADRKLASKAAKEEAEKKRAEERRAAADKKKADEAQRAADARAEREAASSRRAEEQKAADESRALERRAAAEKAAEDRRAEAEKAAEEVRLKEALEAEKKAAEQKSAEQKSSERKGASRNGGAPPVAVASDPAPAPASAASSAPAPKATATPASAPASKPATASASAPAGATSTSAAAPASNGGQKPAGAQATAGQKPADGAKPADGEKSAVDAKRPPAVIRSGEQPDEWKMKSEKPRAEGSTAQTEKGKSSDAKSADTTSASAAGQSKPAASTPPKPKEPWRGWSDRALISLNAGWQTASFDLRDTRNFEPPIPGDREQRTLAADYSVKSGMSLDLGGGFRVWRALAAGVSVTRFEDSRDVPVSGTVPHPFFFNRTRSIAGTTSGAREEMAVHVDAMWVMPIRPKMTLAIFGGPSFYSVKQTVVSDYDYNQSYPYDDVTLTRVIAEDESTSVTGMNFGADVGYYFTDTIGVGGVIRFGRASVDTSIGSLDVGGPEFGVGLRIRIPQGRPRTRAITPQPPPTTPR